MVLGLVLKCGVNGFPQCGCLSVPFLQLIFQFVIKQNVELVTSQQYSYLNLNQNIFSKKIGKAHAPKTDTMYQCHGTEELKLSNLCH